MFPPITDADQAEWSSNGKVVESHLHQIVVTVQESEPGVDPSMFVDCCQEIVKAEWE